VEQEISLTNYARSSSLREYNCLRTKLLAIPQVYSALEVFISKINMFALWALSAARLAVAS
jgi:hypothetical protein